MKRKKNISKKVWRFCFLTIILFFGWSCVQTKTYAKETEKNPEQEIMDRIDWNDMDYVVEEKSFKEIVQMFLDGDIKGVVKLSGEVVKEQVFSVLTENKKALLHMLMIALMAAVFVNFSHVFSGKQVADTGFFILYLSLITILLKSFDVMMDAVSASLLTLTDFMRALCPAYLLVSSVVAGSTTSVLFYNLILFLIFLVETIMLHVILPLIHIYMIIRILDYLSPEPYLARFAELIDMVIKWTLKTILIGVAGVNIIQGLISPALDAVRRSGLQKGIEAIPGVGQAIGGMTEVVLSTVVLIKNGIGMAGAVVCVVICIVPIFQIAVMSLSYKCIAALAEPVSDKRIVGCIAAAGDGAVHLLKTVYTSAVLFLITIVVVASFRT